MRIKGKITFWKSEKGYGFITPESGAKQVFVYINAFADKSKRPQVNQLVSFSLSKDKQGRPCAVDVTRASDRIPKKISRNRRSSSVPGVVMLLLVGGIAGAFVYSRYQKTVAVTKAPSAPARLISNPASFSRFSCDGRTHCFQMTSCAEAKYFIQNCPNTRMDGDGDGIPCESQWCI